MRRSKSNIQTENISAKSWYPKVRDVAGTFTSTGTLLKSTNTNSNDLIPGWWLVNAANDQVTKIDNVWVYDDGTVAVSISPALTTPIVAAALKTLPSYGLAEIKATAVGGTMTVRPITQSGAATYPSGAIYAPDANDFGIEPVLITPASTAVVQWD